MHPSEAVGDGSKGAVEFNEGDVRGLLSDPRAPLDSGGDSRTPPSFRARKVFLTLVPNICPDLDESSETVGIIKGTVAGRDNNVGCNKPAGGNGPSGFIVVEIALLLEEEEKLDNS